MSSRHYLRLAGRSNGESSSELESSPRSDYSFATQPSTPAGTIVTEYEQVGDSAHEYQQLVERARTQTYGPRRQQADVQRPSSAPHLGQLENMPCRRAFMDTYVEQPGLVILEEGEDTMCRICYRDMARDNTANPWTSTEDQVVPVRLPCQGSHTFCGDCIRDWLNKHRQTTCPSCRDVLLRDRPWRAQLHRVRDRTVEGSSALQALVLEYDESNQNLDLSVEPLQPDLARVAGSFFGHTQITTPADQMSATFPEITGRRDTAALRIDRPPSRLAPDARPINRLESPSPHTSRGATMVDARARPWEIKAHNGNDAGVGIGTGTPDDPTDHHMRDVSPTRGSSDLSSQPAQPPGSPGQ